MASAASMQDCEIITRQQHKYRQGKRDVSRICELETAATHFRVYVVCNLQAICEACYFPWGWSWPALLLVEPGNGCALVAAGLRFWKSWR